MSKRSLFVLPVLCTRVRSVAVDCVGVRSANRFLWGSAGDLRQGGGRVVFCIEPHAAGPAASRLRVQDVVILVDTSASQRGLFRSDSLLAVEDLVSRLDPHDRVKLLAVDLEAVPMSDGFVGAGSKEMNEALAKLQRRAPLGSTDMVVALQAAWRCFEEPVENPRAVVYVGDGLSRANLFGDPEIQELVEQLVAAARVGVQFCDRCRTQRRLSWRCWPIRRVAWSTSTRTTSRRPRRPVRDWPVPFSCRCSGRSRSSSRRGSSSIIRSRFPPLRTDRDTILIGKLESPRSAAAVDDGRGRRQVDGSGVGPGGGAIQRRLCVPAAVGRPGTRQRRPDAADGRFGRPA